MSRKKKLSREHRAKISASLKARWAVPTEVPPASAEPNLPRWPKRLMLHGYPAPKPGRRF